MLLANHRIELDARPTATVPTVLEVVLLGHCPSPVGQGDVAQLFASGVPAKVSDGVKLIGNIRWDNLARDRQLLAEIGSLGFAPQTARLQELVQALDSGTGAGEQKILLQPQDRLLMELYNLPIPLYSFGHFQALFPDAFDTATHYRSVLAGDRAWLPLAVQDFFANSSGDHPLKLWILRVDESAGSQAFLPTSGANMIEPETLGAFERALLIPRVGILALPDLERLQIPAHLEDIPRMRLDNPVPAFLPCGTDLEDGQRERRHGNEIAAMPEPLAPRDIILPIARALAQFRPDMQCLLTAPLAAVAGSERPSLSPEFIDLLSDAAGLDADGALTDDAPKPLTQAMRHLQILFPYLRGSDRKLSSPTGLIAGMQAAVSQQQGPWRSIGERPLPGRCLPWPPLTQQHATALRTRPGITTLLHRAGNLIVDDERICTPCLSGNGLAQLSKERRNEEQWRSAEIMRFIGWLRRELQTLGERMIFNVDPRDPRSALALRAFFTRLHGLGALRGRRAEDGFTLTQRNDSEGLIAFDIEIAPAYPIDRIRISFLQDRHSASASTTIEVSHAG